MSAKTTVSKGSQCLLLCFTLNGALHVAQLRCLGCQPGRSFARSIFVTQKAGECVLRGNKLALVFPGNVTGWKMQLSFKGHFSNCGYLECVIF